MKYFFITGSSRGLGKALVNLLLRDPENRVVGIARTNTIQHPNYSFYQLDLSDISKVKQKASDIFKGLDEAEKIVLINNAGVLGKVGHVGKVPSETFEYVYNVNLVAPAILTNEFINCYLSCVACHKLIVNVSSGAARKPTDGWAAYCSSKAALDMFSQVVGVEKQKDKNNLKIISVAPGIVDTDMQTEIRHADREDFSRVDEFIEYKKENMLMSPEKVAEKYLHIINNEDQFTERVISVRDVY